MGEGGLVRETGEIIGALGNLPPVVVSQQNGKGFRPDSGNHRRRKERKGPDGDEHHNEKGWINPGYSLPEVGDKRKGTGGSFLFTGIG